MKEFVFSLFCFLATFFISLFLEWGAYKILKKLKARQTIYEYVDMHKAKAGTPTMGGVAFVIATILSSVFFLNGYLLPVLAVVGVMLLNALVGVYDDMVKIKKKQNGGLKPWQKLVFQIAIFTLLGIALVEFRLTNVIIPFFKTSVNLGYFIIPVVVIVGVFFTNCTNLADGLDGLECFITMPVSAVLGVVLLLISSSVDFNFVKNVDLINNFSFLCIIFTGAIFAFVFFNSYPAKIFMGDTGSLAVGSLLVSIGFATGSIIYLLMFGFMFVLTGLSVVLQVSYYKLTKKRIFLMAPLHHHFEKKGYHESKISIVYFMITLIVSLLILLLEFI